MPRSMTGFGSAHVEIPQATVTVEVRSVNHRYCDVRMHAPSGLTELSAELERMVRAQVGRGRIDVSVSLDRVAEAQVAVEVDISRARALADAYRRLAGALGVEASTPLDWIAAAPHVVKTLDAAPSSEVLGPATHRALKRALAQLVEMRDTEGAALARELKGHLERVEALVADIRARSPRAVGERSNRLRERVAALAMDASVDEIRLAQEIALLADRSDVTEEMERLASHLVQFAGQLQSADMVGRKLDFLVQEMNREANTVGSKCQDAPIAHLVVELKTELERIREQVQNLE